MIRHLYIVTALDIRTTFTLPEHVDFINHKQGKVGYHGVIVSSSTGYAKVSIGANQSVRHRLQNSLLTHPISPGQWDAKVPRYVNIVDISIVSAFSPTGVATIRRAAIASEKDGVVSPCKATMYALISRASLESLHEIVVEAHRHFRHRTSYATEALFPIIGPL